MLPHSTVALSVSQNYSRVTNLKWTEFGIVHLLYSASSASPMQEVTQLKSSTMRKIPKDGHFVLSLKRNYRASSKQCATMQDTTVFSSASKS